MKAIKTTIICFWIFLPKACVEEYYPENQKDFADNLVIHAHLTDLDQSQEIRISRSGNLRGAEYKPESGCFIQVKREDGEFMDFIETGPGIYSAKPDRSFIVYGMQYELSIITPDGNEYLSDPETLLRPMDIDSIYYHLEKMVSSTPGDTLSGIRFYLDYSFDHEISLYNRWELIETYEFQNPNYQGYIYDVDRKLKPLPDELSDRQCWITNPIREIYTQSTLNVSGGVYRRYPLHFVSNETQQLLHGYSLLVRQYTLTKGAYTYWNAMKNNSNAAGIFDKQPVLAPSNICNISDEDEYVIGYFSISGARQQRIFIENVEGLEIVEKIFCFPKFELGSLYYISRDLLPRYLSRATWPEDGKVYLGEVALHCLDCREYKNSEPDPPDFWPRN
ncbi:MAG: DUF4249 domain-containing protein [Bacteroidales bacterium]|nr:DUF4249 domain-containing protein [Bacteroidales bacterium]